MNFQDTLRDNIKSKNETYNEQKIYLKQQIYESAQESLRYIKNVLMKNAQNGVYQHGDDKKVIEAVWQVPVGYFLCSSKYIEATFKRNVWGKCIVATPSKFQTIFDLQPFKKEEFELYLSYLKEMAKEEDIEFVELVVANWKTNQRYQFPSIQDVKLQELDWYLATKWKIELQNVSIERQKPEIKEAVIIEPEKHGASHIVSVEQMLKKVRIDVGDETVNLPKKKSRAVNLVQRMYEQVKFTLIDAYNKKEYQVVNGEILFYVMCEFPQTYLKNFNIKANRNTVVFSMASEYSEECDYMTMQLRKYLEAEKIKVKIRVMEKMSKKDYRFTKEYRNISNNKKDYVLGMLCSCTMPVPQDVYKHRYILGINLLPSSNNDAVKIQWNNIQSSKLYEIWRNDETGKHMIGTTDRNAVTYTDRDIQIGKEYFYQVVCLCLNGERIESSLESIIISDGIISQSTIKEIKPDIDSMDGHEFEKFCGNLLSCNGYENIYVTRGSGDQGIDIIAYKDGVKFGIQCKCYSSDIGNKAVQEAYAGKKFYDCHVGVVLTNRYFTKSAKELAQKSGILLWDRGKLLQMAENKKQGE